MSNHKKLVKKVNIAVNVFGSMAVVSFTLAICKMFFDKIFDLSGGTVFIVICYILMAVFGFIAAHYEGVLKRLKKQG